MRLEPGENGELLAESCSPLVEWERSQSRPSSWPRSCGDGPYLPGVKEKVKVEVKTKIEEENVDSVFLQDKLIWIQIFFFFFCNQRGVFFVPSSQISSQDLTLDESDTETRNNSVNTDRFSAVRNRNQ